MINHDHALPIKRQAALEVPQAQHEQEAPGAQGLPVPAAWLDHRSGEPGLSNGHHIPMARGWVYLATVVDWASRRVLSRAPRRFVWNPTVRIVGRNRARWAYGQAAFEPVHL